jgi:hypothetical protein
MVHMELHAERTAAGPAPALPAAIADIVHSACEQLGQSSAANAGILLHLDADDGINCESPEERKSRLKVRAQRN